MGATEKNKWKLIIMFTLNFAFFFVELIVGRIGRSSSLLADSFHMLSDVGAIVIAFVAVKLSAEKWDKNTYGWARAEILGALVNTVFLVALCFIISLDAAKKLIEPEPITDARLVLIVGSIGLVMNLVGLVVFCDHGHSHNHDQSHNPDDKTLWRASLTSSNRLTRMMSSMGPGDAQEEGEEVAVSRVHIPGKPQETPKVVGASQMNIKSVFLHTLADTLGSVIVIVAALVAYLADGWEGNLYLDPSLTLVMVILIMWSACPLLKESSLILLQSVPAHINLPQLEQKLLTSVDGVTGVHELHVWQLAGDRIIGTAHIKCRNLAEYFAIAEKVKTLFHDAGIHSTTIQPEFSEQNPDVTEEDAPECYLSCQALKTLSSANCQENTCCPPPAASITNTLKSNSKLINK